MAHSRRDVGRGARGPLATPRRGVVVAHNAELTREQRQWVAVLGAPPGSALAGLTAAALDGLTGFVVPETYLVMPVGASAPTLPNVVPWWSAYLGPDDVHPLREPRRTRLPRSILDAAAHARYERQARAVVLASVQQRLVRPDDLRAALPRRGPCRHHAVIVESIDDAEGGIASVPEKDFDMLRRRWLIPEPSRQRILRRNDGRFYLDVDWEPQRLAAEVHGLQHLEQLSWDGDLDRISEIVADGRRMLQFTSYAVRRRQDRVGALLLRAHRNS